METLLKDIQNRLLAEVPALKYVDEDWGQLDYYSPHFPVKWPCALIDAAQATWSNAGHLLQLGVVQVKVRVADLRLTNTSGAAPQGQKQAAFALFATLSNVYKALHGWSGHNHYSALIRTSNSRVKRDDGVRIYDITFTCQVKDSSAVPVLNGDVLAGMPVKIAVSSGQAL